MKDLCNGENEIKLEEEIVLEAKNGDSSLISKEMAEEEQKLLEARVKEERLDDSTESPKLNDNQFTKLDELLNQTQLYSEFLLEKMDDITFVCLCAVYFMHFIVMCLFFPSLRFNFNYLPEWSRGREEIC